MKKLIAFTHLLLLALTACDSGIDAIQPPDPSPLTTQQLDKTLAFGSGIISPYKFELLPNDPGSMIIITGRGESFGESYAYFLDAATLTEQKPRLPVGRNASDLIIKGNFAVVSARSSNQLFLIDIDLWQVVDTFELGYPPVALASLGGTHIAVSSVSSDATIELLSISQNRIEALNSRSLGGVAFNLNYASDSNLIYALGPDIGIDILNADTLTRQKNIAVAGALGFASVIWNGKLVLTDRDGYIHLLDLQSDDLATVDLAPLLGLERDQVSLRGIDPLDLMILSNNKLAISNQRQNGLVVEYTPDQVPPLSYVNELRINGYGGYLPQTDQLMWLRGTADIISKVNLSDLIADSTPAVVNTRSGTRIIDAIALGSGANAMLAVMDSTRTITMVDSLGAITDQFSSANGEFWNAPLAAGPDSSLLMAGALNSTPVLWHVDRTGVLRFAYTQQVNGVFSISANGNQVVMTDRTAEELQIIDLVTAQTAVVKLRRTRPRHSVQLASDDILVIHDTTPDIGISVLQNGVDSFSDFMLSRWWSSLIRRGDGAVAATFAGDLAIFNENGEPVDSLSVNFDGVKHVANAANGNVWMVSEDAGAAVLASMTSRSIIERVDTPGMIKLYEFLPGRVWIINLTNVNVVTLQ